MPEFIEIEVKKEVGIIGNPVTAEALQEFRGDRSFMRLAKLTGLSRLTLMAWARGKEPDLGVLLRVYFDGREEGRKLAYEMLYLLRPDIAKRLPEQ